MEKNLKIETSWKVEGCNEEEEEEGEPVSPTGQYFNSSVLSATILSVLEFEVPIDDSQAMSLLRDVFLPINPRFSSIMVIGKNGEKRWKRVEVNLEEHFNVPTFPPDLSPKCYDNHFDEYLSKLSAVPFPQNRPLWEIHVVKYPTSKAEGQLIFKLHHALGDGYSLMGALLSCLQRADDPSRPLTFPRLGRETNQVGLCTRVIKRVPKVMNIAYNTLYDYGCSILKSSVLEDDKSPVRSGVEDLQHKPMRISTVELSLHKVKQIKVELGVTINDVVAGIIYHGVRLYMKGRSEENWGSSRVTALVLMHTRSDAIGYKSVSEMVTPNKRSGQKLWGNQFAFLHAQVPDACEKDEFLDPLKFVVEANKTIQRKKSSLAFILVGHTLEFIRKLAGPEAVARFIRRTIGNASMVISNLVGPVEKMALANHPVKGLYFMVVGVPLSLEISVISYMETLRIGIGVEKDFIDVQEFISCIEKAFELTFNAARNKERRVKIS